MTGATGCPGPLGDAEPSEVAKLVAEYLIRQESCEVDRPHVVMIEDHTLGIVHVIGPFANGFEALAAAEDERETDLESLGDVGRTYSVRLLLDP